MVCRKSVRKINFRSKFLSISASLFAHQKKNVESKNRCHVVKKLLCRTISFAVRHRLRRHLGSRVYVSVCSPAHTKRFIFWTREQSQWLKAMRRNVYAVVMMVKITQKILWWLCGDSGVGGAGNNDKMTVDLDAEHVSWKIVKEFRRNKLENFQLLCGLLQRIQERARTHRQFR